MIILNIWSGKTIENQDRYIRSYHHRYHNIRSIVNRVYLAQDESGRIEIYDHEKENVHDNPDIQGIKTILERKQTRKSNYNWLQELDIFPKYMNHQRQVQWALEI